jgi:chitinase
MPASKITLGVPGYGYLQISSANHLSNRRRSDRFLRKRADITLRNSEGGTTAGQINYNQLVKQGALTQDSNGSYVGSSGFTRYWDSCSSTPWLKSTVSGQIVTYDDEESLRLKGQFAKEKGIRGCSIWSLDGEYLNGKFPLSQAARDGMGI